MMFNELHLVTVSPIAASPTAQSSGVPDGSASTAMLRSALSVIILAVACSASDIVSSFSDLGGKPYDVTYNKRSMIVGGKPVLLMSGSVHYVRSTPEMW